MKFRVAVQLISEDGKYSHTIYSHKWMPKELAFRLAKIVKELFYSVERWKDECQRRDN
jgi:hypothetical protein